MNRKSLFLPKLSTQKIESTPFYLLILFLPTQLGKHFWPDFAVISGIRVDYLSPTVYLTDVIILLLFISSISRIVKSSKLKIQSNNPKFKVLIYNSALLIVFLLFLLLNVYLSQNILNGFYHLLKLLEFSFLAYYVASTVKNIQQVKKVFFFLGIGVIGQSILAIMQFVKQGSLGGLFYFLGERTFTAGTPGIANASINGELLLRAYGTFSHPNVLAGFLLICMSSLLFTYSWTRTKMEKTVWILALLLGSSASLLTMSRIVFVLWAFFLISVFVFSLRNKASRWLTVFAVLCFFIFFLTTPFASRLLGTSLTEESFVVRADLTRASVEMFVQQPLLGVGLGNFLPVLSTQEMPLSLGLYLQPVHNVSLLVLAETGIVGLLFAGWFLVRTYQRLFRSIQKGGAFPYRIFVILLSVVLVLGSMDHYFLTLQQGQLLLAIVLGFCWTTLRS